MGLSQGYGSADDTESIAAIHAALDAGVTLLDTAISYGQGHNEALVGRAVASSGVPRDNLQIATKFGIARGDHGVHLDAHPDRVAGYCDESLRRLGTETIDLYYLHRVDPQVPIEESIGAMSELVSQGKVRHLGVSEVTADQLRRAHAIHPIAAVQFEWSLMWREPEVNIVPAARQLGVGLVPYSPLGRGLLGGSLNTTSVAESPFRANDPRFNGSSLTANMRQVDALASFAQSRSMTVAQLALAWLLAQPMRAPRPSSRQSLRHWQRRLSARLPAWQFPERAAGMPAWQGLRPARHRRHSSLPARLRLGRSPPWSRR